MNERNDHVFNELRMIRESIMGKVDGNATIFYEWPGSPTDGGSYAGAEENEEEWR